MDVPIYYDPLLAKLIAYGESRQEAIHRLLRAIDDYRISGVKTTLPFGKFVLNHPDFLSGQFDTNFVGRNFKPEFLRSEQEDEMEIAALVAGFVYEEKETSTLTQPRSPITRKSNWVKNRSSYR
jgi:acetyl/propionyl-CoA carboxylase alpha subunit